MSSKYSITYLELITRLTYHLRNLRFCIWTLHRQVEKGVHKKTHPTSLTTYISILLICAEAHLAYNSKQDMLITIIVRYTRQIQNLNTVPLSIASLP
jgi:hypothetical protein